VFELTDQAKGWLSELTTTFKTRQNDYSWAEVVGGYSVSEPEPLIAHMVIRFHPKEDTQTSFRRDYSHFTLLSLPLDVQTGWNLFEALVRGEQVSIGKEFPLLRFGNCRLEQPSRHVSKSYPFNEDWPVDVGLLTSNNDGRLRHELLASSSAPLYTGPQEAINEVTGVPVGWKGYAPTVYIIMPDRRVRIRDLRVSTNAVSGQIERGPLSRTELVLKGYASTVDSTVRFRERLGTFSPPSRFEVDDADGPFKFETGFFPNHLIIVVIEKGSDIVLDQREYESDRTVLANDISFEADTEYLEDLIRNGESDRIEFKKSFEGNEGWLRTVCAFANGDGGMIFFGVDDDSSIAGLAETINPDRIAQKIRGSIEPFPSYQFNSAELDGKIVVYIHVASGPEKLYSVKDKGVFVRTQATTRLASRHELLTLAKPALGTQGT
jgi:hypothetical protein